MRTLSFRKGVLNLVLLSALTALASNCRPLPSMKPPSQAPTPSVEGSLPLLKPGSRLAIGEMHGRAEFPELLVRLARQAVGAGPVTVYLELPALDEPIFENLVSGKGGKEPPAEGAWARAYQDGRSSRAMWSLVVRLADLATAPGRLQVRFIDPPAEGHPDRQTARRRDRAMADNVIASMRARPSDVHLLLVGNVHSRPDRGVPWDPEYEPLAYLVKRSGLPVTALLGTYLTGAIWSCETPDAMSCREHVVEGTEALGGSGFRLQLREGVQGGHGGTAFVGPLHPAPPALPRAKAEVPIGGSNG